MEDQIQLENSISSSFESFTIGVEEAAEILGVNRTRLSQLTTKGVFAYERRKIGNHNRLFYRLNDLLSYQRDNTYGNLNARHIPQERFIPISIEKETNKKISSEESLENKSIQTPLNTKSHSFLQIKKPQKTAIEFHEKENLKQRIDFLETQLNQIQLMLKHAQILFENMEIHLKNQDLKLSKLNTKPKKSNFLERQTAVQLQSEKAEQSQAPHKIKIKFRVKKKTHSFKK
jgi:hypothetical protein